MNTHPILQAFLNELKRLNSVEHLQPQKLVTNSPQRFDEWTKDNNYPTSSYVAKGGTVLFVVNVQGK